MLINAPLISTRIHHLDIIHENVALHGIRLINGNKEEFNYNYPDNEVIIHFFHLTE